MLELAVSAGVMVTCLAGTFQFGYTFYVYNQLVTAVGNGARYAAQRTYRAATPDDIDRGNAAIRNMVVYGDAQPATDAAPVVAGSDAGASGGALDCQAGRRAEGGRRLDSRLHRRCDLQGRSPSTASRSVEFPYVGRYAPAEREP